jgi:hypothetical protein
VVATAPVEVGDPVVDDLDLALVKQNPFLESQDASLEVIAAGLLGVVLLEICLVHLLFDTGHSNGEIY